MVDSSILPSFNPPLGLFLIIKYSAGLNALLLDGASSLTDTLFDDADWATDTGSFFQCTGIRRCFVVEEFLNHSYWFENTVNAFVLILIRLDTMDQSHADCYMYLQS